jgi:hypothetical protein
MQFFDIVAYASVKSAVSVYYVMLVKVRLDWAMLSVIRLD